MTDTLPPLDFDTAVALVNAVVDEFGADETVYTQRYECHGAPSCLVGHVMARHGVSVAELAEWDNNGAGVHSLYCRNLTPIADPHTAEYLQYVQALQDDGFTWGKARDGALDLTNDPA